MSVATVTIAQVELVYKEAAWNRVSGARTVGVVPGHSCVLIYEHTTAHVPVTVQQDNQTREHANTNKTL